MRSLPFDVLSLIISRDNFKVGSYFGHPGVDSKSVYHICLVNKTFLELGRPLLWHTRSLWYHEDEDDFGDPYSGPPAAPPSAPLAQHLRSLVFNFDCDDSHTFATRQSRQMMRTYIKGWLWAAPNLESVEVRQIECEVSARGDAVSLVLSLVSELPPAVHIKQFDISTDGDQEEYGLDGYAETAVDHWMANIRSMPCLRCLNLCFSAVLGEGEGEGQGAFFLALPLDSLALRINNYPLNWPAVTYNSDAQVDFTEVAKNDFAGQLLLACVPTLRHLVATDFWHIPLTIIAEDGGKSFGQLRSLSIEAELGVFNPEGLCDTLVRVLPFLTSLNTIRVDDLSGRDLANPAFFTVLPTSLVTLEINSFYLAEDEGFDQLLDFIRGGRCPALRRLVLGKLDDGAKEKLQDAFGEKRIMLCEFSSLYRAHESDCLADPLPPASVSEGVVTSSRSGERACD